MFDLDDTLFKEIDFVKSGFKACAKYMNMNFGIKRQEFYEILIEILEKEGRGKIFDNALQRYNRYSKQVIQELVDVYRSHKPKIRPYSDVAPTLRFLKKNGCKLAIITDGLASVQRNKVASLGIGNLFNTVIYSDDFGDKYWKPHRFPYKRAIEYLGINTKEAVYVGDNPHKDFFGANTMGITTIRLLKGPYKSEKVKGDHEARYQVKSIGDIPNVVAFLNGKL